MAGRAHLCSGISPSFVLSVAKDLMEFLFSILAWPAGVLRDCVVTFPELGGGVRCVEVNGLGECVFGDERRGVEEPEVPENFESEDSFLPDFGRTQPSVFAGPRGVSERSGALFERECFECPVVDDEVFPRR